FSQHRSFFYRLTQSDMLHNLIFLLTPLAQPQTVDYFPLQEGNQWIYRATRLRPEPWIITVGGTRKVNDVEYFQVSGFPGEWLLLRKDESGALVLYDAAGQGERVWAALQAPVGESFRTGIDNCTSSGRVRSRDGELRSPLGEFQNALV